MIIDSKEREQSKKYFFSKTKKEIGNNRMLREIESLIELTPQICQIVRVPWVNGETFQQSKTSRVLYLCVYLLAPLKSNCAICKYLCYYIRYLFIIIEFVVDSSHFHIY